MRHILGPVAAAFGLHAGLLACFVAAFHGDVSSLLCVCGRMAGKGPYAAVRTRFPAQGYDGQYYYALAQSPWGRKSGGHGIDDPVVRQSRILLPALGWLLSGGNAQLLLWVLPLINLLAIAALTALAALLALRHGLNPWWAVLVPVAANVGLPALRTLTDVLSTLAVAGLLVTWMLRWPRWLLIPWALAAVLCREQNMAVILAVMAGAAFCREGRVCAGLAAVLAAWGAWVLTLHSMYGKWPFLGTNEHLQMPLSGLLFRWNTLDQVHSRAGAIVQGFAVLLLLVEIGLAVYLIRLRPDPVVLLVALGGAALAAVGGWYIYTDFWSYNRVFAWLPLGISLACLQVRWRWPLVVMSLAFLLPVGAVVQVYVK
jgi:hypothetical protein